MKKLKNLILKIKLIFIFCIALDLIIYGINVNLQHNFNLKNKVNISGVILVPGVVFGDEEVDTAPAPSSGGTSCIDSDNHNAVADCPLEGGGWNIDFSSELFNSCPCLHYESCKNTTLCKITPYLSGTFATTGHGNKNTQARVCFIKKYLQDVLQQHSQLSNLSIEEDTGSSEIELSGVNNLPTGLSELEPEGLESVDEDDYIGNSFFKRCQRSLPSTLSDLPDQPKKYFLQGWKTLVTDTINKNIKNADIKFRITSRKSKISTDTENFVKKVDEFINKAQEEYYKNVKCHAAIELVKHNTNFRERNLDNRPQVSSFDNKITCPAANAESQDYEDCEDMVDKYNGSSVIRTGVDKIGQVTTALKQQEALFEQSQNADDPAAALTLQKEMLEHQQTLLIVRGSINTAITTVLAASRNFTDMDDVIATCKSKLDAGRTAGEFENYNILVSNYLEPLQAFAGKLVKQEEAAAATNIAPPRALVGEELCSSVAHSGKLELITSDRAKDQATALLAEVATQVAVDTTQAILLNGQIEKIQAAIDALENFDPEVAGTALTDELMVTKCQADPSAEGCDSFAFKQHQGIVGNNMQLGGTTGLSTSSGTAETGDDGVASAVDEISATDRSDIASAGGSIASSTGKSSDTLDPMRGSGPVKTKPGSGSSGGSGSAGAVSAPSGGGGGRGGGGGNSSASRATKRYNYSDAGKIGFGGGGLRGAGGKKKKKGNPFAGLVGKKGSVLNTGRKPASLGKKSNSLFIMLSNRYKNVSDKERLHQYEIK